jgi:hypothetical protein
MAGFCIEQISTILATMLMSFDLVVTVRRQAKVGAFCMSYEYSCTSRCRSCMWLSLRQENSCCAMPVFVRFYPRIKWQLCCLMFVSPSSWSSHAKRIVSIRFNTLQTFVYCEKVRTLQLIHVYNDREWPWDFAVHWLATFEDSSFQLISDVNFS